MYLFFIAAIFALLFTVFHVASSVLAFDAYKNDSRAWMGLIFGAHMLLSYAVCLCQFMPRDVRVCVLAFDAYWNDSRAWMGLIFGAHMLLSYAVSVFGS